MALCIGLFFTACNKSPKSQLESFKSQAAAIESAQDYVDFMKDFEEFNENFDATKLSEEELQELNNLSLEIAEIIGEKSMKYAADAASLMSNLNNYDNDADIDDDDDYDDDDDDDVYDDED